MVHRLIYYYFYNLGVKGGSYVKKVHKVDKNVIDKV